jgi:putative ABC transport system permease protein
VVAGALARAAARRSGLVGFLGLARAARGGVGARGTGRSGPSVLPLVALLLAITTGGFGATVLDSVGTARLRVARVAAGGDASVAAPDGRALPDGLARTLGELPGVRTSVPLWFDYDSFVFGTRQGSTQVTVVVADPVAYAELSRAVGRGSFDAALLAGGGTGAPDSPVPALFSADLAQQAPPGGYVLRPGSGGELTVAVKGVIDGTPARPGPGGSTVVLPAGPATARIPQADRPNRWFATGTPDGDRVRELVRAAVPAAPSSPASSGQPPSPGSDAASDPAPAGAWSAGGYVVRSGAAVVAELGGDPLQRSAERLFWASLAGAAGFALLAVLLTLLRATPERAALLARLRTMGLRPRQGVALILAEALPQALAAAAGGALVAAAAVALLGPSLDLSTLVGARVPTGVRLAVRPVVTQALGLAALVAAAVLVEAAVTGRRQITTELRAGDQR